MSKRICMFTDGYPTPGEPFQTFLQPVAQGFVKLGYECTVIAPQSITHQFANKRKLRPYQWRDIVNSERTVQVIQPPVLSFSNKRKHTLLNWIGNLWNNFSINHAFRKVKNPSVLYAHFWRNGIRAIHVNKKKIPLFIVTGESNIQLSEKQIRVIRDHRLEIAGIIGVSQKSIDESKGLDLISHNQPWVVLPNGIDEKVFHKMPKEQCRQELKINLHDIIAVFVGAFNERKGVLRVLEASKDVEGLKLFFIGSGELKPEGDNILFSGRLDHNDIPLYLNAADFFVLPTKAEGCCNAIVEALACGLPVISSNASFNDGLLDEFNSIRIDPENIAELTAAMKKLAYNKDLRETLGNNAERFGINNTIENRVLKIVLFMENNCESNSNKRTNNQ